MGGKSAQPVADHLALGRILAGSNLGFDHLGHLKEQGDALGLGDAHGSDFL